MSSDPHIRSVMQASRGDGGETDGSFHFWESCCDMLNLNFMISSNVTFVLYGRFF